MELSVTVRRNLVTFALLLFGAGLVGQAATAFQQAGLVPTTLPVWDANGFLPDAGLGGRLLRGSLMGYSAAPSLLQVILWAGYLALVAAIVLDAGGRADGNALAEPFAPIGRSYRDNLYALLRWPPLTTIVPVLMGLVLVGLLAIALLGIPVGPFDNRGPLRLGRFHTDEIQNNAFNFVMWVVWLPLLSIGTVLLGRVWCGNLCPLRLVADAGTALGRWLGRRRAAMTPSLRLGWLLPTTFILTTFIVKWWPVQEVARDGALLFLVFAALAAVVGVVFYSGTWCRYVCPIGGWLARITRLSPLALRPDADVCVTCAERPCVQGTDRAGRCPTFLNPSKLESNRHCLKCWKCVVNCPESKASLRIGWHAPGAELLRPCAPDLWESLFVAALMGVYIATGHRSPTLAALPWPAVFFGLIAAATVGFLVLSAAAAWAGRLRFRSVLTTFGYIFLPLEFSAALLAFGDEAIEFLDVATPAAAILLTAGFVWSTVLAVSIVRNQCRDGGRPVAAGLPVAIAMLVVLCVWLSWYGSPAAGLT